MSLGLYVHLPFCRVHCTYCPFAVSTDLALQDRYFDAIIAEIRAKTAANERPSIESLYFGGGTPSRSSVENLTRVRAVIGERFPLVDGGEFTFEANPEDITPESLGEWRGLGVNRLSVGVQSFRDAELLPLGRVHGAARAREAVALATGTGFRTSLDLILGLPGQTAESFSASLEQAIAAGVGHMSLYMLDLEEGTALHAQVGSGRARLPDDDLIAELYFQAVNELAAAGLVQYEISNFARPGQESRHNLRYWSRQPYYGVGLGAHSFVARQRFANSRQMERYLETPGAVDFLEELGEAERRRELIFLSLRQAAGIQSEEVVRLCGQEGIEWIDQGLTEGWLWRNGSRIAFTTSGFLLSNEYISQLF